MNTFNTSANAGPLGNDLPFSEILSSLMQRLVRLVGAPAAVHLASTIPKLSVDAEGRILDFDRVNPLNTARLLIEQYEAISRELTSALKQQAVGEAATLGATGSDQPVAPAAPTIRIVVVDDHALVREGLVSLIDPQPDMLVVGQAGSVREAIALAHSLRPDVVLMDFTLPDGTGDEATRVILSALPQTKIVFLTVHDDDERLFAAISAGAIGYMLKSIRSADLLNRLRDVIRGDVVLSPSISRRILEKVAQRPSQRLAMPQPAEQLTERELEILRFLAQGLTNRQIAAALNLSIRTVEYHRANLTSKLGLQSRADLVRYAAAHNLFDAEGAR
jgi:two-component system, NarL family, response regulator NreC